MCLLTMSAYGWYSAQSLPVGYSNEAGSQNTQLNNKLGNLAQSNVSLSEAEFNDVLLASLEADPDGKLLLSISEGIKAVLLDGQVEISAIVNLDKAEKINAEAQAAVQNVKNLFPFLDGSNLEMTVYGEPVARNGQIAIKDNFSIKVGFVPLSNYALRKLGIDVERANTESLKLQFLSVTGVRVTQGNIIFDVAPNF